MAQQMTIQQYWNAVGRPPAPGTPGSALSQNVGGSWFGANATPQNNMDLAALQSGRGTGWSSFGQYQDYLKGLGSPTQSSLSPSGGPPALTQPLQGLYPQTVDPMLVGDLWRRRGNTTLYQQ